MPIKDKTKKLSLKSLKKHLRNKFRIESGDQLEYFTSFIDDSWFLCVRLDAKTQVERTMIAMEEAAAALEEVREAFE